MKTLACLSPVSPVKMIRSGCKHWIIAETLYVCYLTAHTICKAILEEESKKPWGSEYLSAEIKREPKLTVSYSARAKSIEDWGAFRIVVPNDVFETVTVIHLGGLTIELEHIGGEHAEDSIVVKVPQDEVMFIGDCYYPPPAHLHKPDSAPSLDMLRRLQNEAYNLYVEGHDKPFTRAELLKFLQEND